MALDKPLDQITEVDLLSLIEAGTPELKTLEYKQSLPGRSDDERKEFLADVSSFANSAGGHLIYGMRADAGVPVDLQGVEDEGDGAILRLESSIRDGINPRIAGIHSRVIELTNSRTAIIISIPKSFASPHMVILKNTSRFYSRASNGKYQLDVQEIRNAFLGSQTTVERIRDFRLDRVSRIRARETPIELRSGPSVALHIFPLNAFMSTTHYDVPSLKADVRIYQQLAPLFCGFANASRVNFDGLLVYKTSRDRSLEGYSQIYRTGIIETVDATFVSSNEDYKHGKIISGWAFEDGLFKFARRALSLLQSIGVEPPLLLTLALIDVRDYTMGTMNHGFFEGLERFDRDILLPQEMLIDSYSVDASWAMKPIVDQVWNAAGFEGSANYRDGKWIANPR